MLVYAIRHAESVANVERNETIALDAPLSRLGERQAEALAARLASDPIVAIYSSPYRRCLQTALPLAAALDLPILLRPELCEFHYLPPGVDPAPVLGPVEEIVRCCDRVRLCPEVQGPVVWPPVREPRQGMVERVHALADAMKEKYRETDDVVVLISHGSPLARLIDAWLTGSDGRSYRFILDNAAIAALRYYEDVSSLICLNETSHLRGLLAPDTANYGERGEIRPRPATGYHS